MRGTGDQQSSMFSYISAEQRVPKDHPLRAIRSMTDKALAELDRGSTRCTRATDGCRSHRRSCCARCSCRCCTLRSERMLMEQLDYNFLFRWFVGLSTDDPVWDAMVFSKNRDRLLGGKVANGLFTAVLGQARERACSPTSISRWTAR